MTESPRWWCPICAARREPSWLGRAGRVAYHRFGEPPFVARHALVEMTARPQKVQA
ncbi:hypothetical protein KZZ52_22925 [Dactylosporangium sp. AC04546]|uniref:hypothetical protein n=1 Tax=Dactylosporangium sp. AC04546 TaxID=2862460 RepID=UPI001EDD9F3C|nr:hypothetical protein [Dactylosporangium sp. AC04546]WVK88133.1 hypothetical protein KZZ52_22925 [Dactylosporangium sp. AC04546]